LADGSSNGEPTSQQSCDLRSTDERLTHSARPHLPIPIGSLLALDTTRRPRHGREAFWVDLRFALNTGSKAAVLDSSQCSFDLTQPAGLAIHVPNRQISFRRILNLIHLVRALLDSDAIPLSQYLNQFGPFSFQDLLNPLNLDAIFMTCLFRELVCLSSLARDGPH
jgi:hypothetical protein